MKTVTTINRELLYKRKIEKTYGEKKRFVLSLGQSGRVRVVRVGEFLLMIKDLCDLTLGEYFKGRGVSWN